MRYIIRGPAIALVMLCLCGVTIVPRPADAQSREFRDTTTAKTHQKEVQKLRKTLGVSDRVLGVATRNLSPAPEPTNRGSNWSFPIETGPMNLRSTSQSQRRTVHVTSSIGTRL
jgi:hypothetical protein